MRPLEWLLFLAFVPALTLPYLPIGWLRHRSLIAAALPFTALLLHLAIEGWRTHMIPLYLLACLLPIVQLAALRGRTSTSLRRRDWLISGAAALLLIGGGILAGWVLPVIALPQPTGPYQVGIVDRELVDAARGRRLMVSVWYPAAQSGTPAPLTHDPDEVMVALAQLGGVPAPLFQHLRYISVAATTHAPVLLADEPFPVLVFSHGMVGLRLQNSSTFQDLASWGYVIVAIDHTDAAAVTVFPDGVARYYDLAHFGMPTGVEPNHALMNEHVFPVWVADQRFVYDTLEAWAANDPLFQQRLDLSRIGSFGHSFGGATALEVCRVEIRCRAAVNLDGGLYGDTEALPAVRPFLLMTSTNSNQYEYAVAKWTNLIAHAAADAYWLEVPNSSHLSFTFTELLSPLLVPAGYEPRVGLHIIDRYLRAFFDTYLGDGSGGSFKLSLDNSDVYWHHK
jgi:predicted dienelactone hydrolase